MNTHAIWKYGAARGVTETPTVFINGVKLDEVPDCTEAWLYILRGVYDSQE